MANESPFLLTKVECPICKTVNEFETVRVGAYTERDRDTDFCPTEIQWRYPRYQAYNPLAFFAATCSHCYYSREFTKSFKEWKNDSSFRTYRLKTVKEKHLDRLATADSVIKRMGEAVDLSRYPSESAILKLHLAIFDEQLGDHFSQLDLGRFYLRIGWVFRGMGKGDNPDQQFLGGLMVEIDNRCSIMETALKNFRDEVDVLDRHVISHFEADQISSQLQAKMAPFREKFKAELKALRDPVEQVESRMESLNQLIAEYRAATLGGEGTSDGGGFGQYESFAGFLLGLKKGWNGIVVNEQEALRKAVKYYSEAFVEGRGIATGNQQIQAAYLIAELSRRIGDFDGAKQYFNTTIKLGQEFIYQNRQDQSRTALARKILELAMEQGRENMRALKST